MKDVISNLQEHVGYWHNRLGQAVHTGFERRLSQYNITVSQWCLMVVLYHKQGRTVRDVAKVISLDVGAVTRLVDRLEEKKLVKRSPDAADGRSVRLNLTRKGTLLVPELANEADRNDEIFYGVLNSQEIVTYKKLLSKLLKGISAEVPDGWIKEDIKRGGMRD